MQQGRRAQAAQAGCLLLAQLDYKGRQAHKARLELQGQPQPFPAQPEPLDSTELLVQQVQREPQAPLGQLDRKGRPEFRAQRGQVAHKDPQVFKGRRGPLGWKVQRDRKGLPARRVKLALPGRKAQLVQLELA